MKDTKNQYFLYVGNAYPHKNLNRLIEAVVLLNRNTDTNVELKIASSRNVFTQRLQAEIEHRNMNKYVTLLGKVTDRELNNLYKNAIGFVFASLSEGFGLPGIEAMNAGTLVLASDIPVFKEIYSDNAVYFDPLDVNSIASALREALNVPKTKRDARIRKAREFVNRYSWAKMAKETLAVYNQAVKCEQQ